jgi:cell division septation protein DedD
MSVVVAKLATPAIAETDLRAEALAVEQLRRKIAGASAGGVAAPPALLAEFARMQKAYLDRKIEFEKQKRLGEVPTPELPAPAPATPALETPAAVESSPIAAPATERKAAARWVWWALLIAAASLAAWLWSR